MEYKIKYMRTIARYIMNMITSTEEGSCMAITDEEVCDNDVFGRGCVDGSEIKYCREHTPSDAIPAGGRMSPVRFKTDDGIKRVD